MSGYDKPVTRPKRNDRPSQTDIDIAEFVTKYGTPVYTEASHELVIIPQDKMGPQLLVEQARDSRANHGISPSLAEEIYGPARDSAANQGLKYDAEKQPLSLLSKVWLLGVASVMGFGAKKYAAHNWRNGIERSRLLSAALRHILAYNEGEDVDPESKLHHLDHASCCLMFAREMHETHPQLDDRWKGIKK